MTPRLTVVIPAYRGEAFLAGTLDCILGQELGDFAVLVSIDGEDDLHTREAYEAAPRDGRVRLVVRPRNAGWAANITACIAEVDTPWTVYWAQDDLAPPDFLRRLMAAGAARPGVPYPDIRYTGAYTHSQIEGDNAGPPRARVLRQIATRGFIPLRGLLPTAAAQAAGPFHDEGGGVIAGDVVWLVHLARLLPFHRVAGLECRKHIHDSGLSGRFWGWDEARRREAWAVHAAYMMDAALAGERQRAGAWEMALAVLRRFAVENRQHQHTYAPPQTAQGILAFLTEIIAAHRVRGLAALPPLLGPDWADLPAAALRRLGILG